MEIPNYDSDSDGEKKYKQLYSYMPSDTFGMLICGNSGCGKTNLLYHMLMKPLLQFIEACFLKLANADINTSDVSCLLNGRKHRIVITRSCTNLMIKA